MENNSWKTIHGMGNILRRASTAIFMQGTAVDETQLLHASKCLLFF
jgi:hypothetical protein